MLCFGSLCADASPTPDFELTSQKGERKKQFPASAVRVGINFVRLAAFVLARSLLPCRVSTNQQDLIAFVSAKGALLAFVCPSNNAATTNQTTKARPKQTNNKKTQKKKSESLLALFVFSSANHDFAVRRFNFGSNHSTQQTANCELRTANCKRMRKSSNARIKARFSPSSFCVCFPLFSFVVLFDV